MVENLFSLLEDLKDYILMPSEGSIATKAHGLFVFPLSMLIVLCSVSISRDDEPSIATDCRFPLASSILLTQDDYPDSFFVVNIRQIPLDLAMAALLSPCQ